MKENLIHKAVSVFMLVFAIVAIFLNYKSGYRSLAINFIPMIFVVIALLGLFKDSVSRFLKKLLALKLFDGIKEWIITNQKFVFFILPLSIFALIGFVALCFALKSGAEIGIAGWITIGMFIILPLIIIYGLVFGFSISEKSQKQIQESLDSVSANAEGILLQHPIFDRNCLMKWDSVDAIVYYNFYVSSDFTEYYEGYKFYLNKLPTYTKYETRHWLNKIFPNTPKSKIVDIKVETNHFQDIPKMIENYLDTEINIDFKSPIQGTLVSSKIYKDKATIIKKYQPINNSREQIIYNKQNLTMEEILKNYR